MNGRLDDNDDDELPWLWLWWWWWWWQSAFIQMFWKWLNSLDVGSAALIALISVICHLVVSCYLNLLLWLNFTHFIHLSLEKVKILPQFGHLFIQPVNFSQYFDHMSSKSNWPLAGSVGANPRGRASCFSCHQKSHKTDKCSKLCRSIIENAPKYILHQIEAIWTQYLCIT